MDTELLGFGRAILGKQPFSVLLGARLEQLTPGHAELLVELRPELLQQHGFAHGGVLGYLADNALTFAAGSVLGDSVTVEMKINYLRPARDCERLRAVADLIDAGPRQCVCRCEVFAESASGRTLCAAAQGTLRKVGA